MIPEEKPRGLLGSLGIQKMEEGAEGEAGQRFFERDTFKDTAAQLAQGFAAMGSNPALQKMTADVASQRTESKAKNKTMEFLKKLPNGEELIRIAEVAGPQAAMKYHLESRKAKSGGRDTALMTNALAAGYTPGTPEYQRFVASGGDIFNQEAAIRANLPRPEAGMAYEFSKDDRGNIIDYKLVPIKGGTADLDVQKSKDSSDTSVTTAGGVLNNIDAIQDKLENSMLPVSGFSGSQLRKIPGTSAYDVNSLATTIRANIGFDRLQRMRMESPTGGALGNVSNQELDSLQATLGNLDQSQSQQQFEDQLQIIENMYLSIVEKFNSYPDEAKAKAGYSNIGLSQGSASGTQPTALSEDAASFLEK